MGVEVLNKQGLWSIVVSIRLISSAPAAGVSYVISGGLCSSVATWSNQVWLGQSFEGIIFCNFYSVCQIKVVVIFFVILFYLQSVPVHSANCV
jgi:hypothetical protein